MLKKSILLSLCVLGLGVIGHVHSAELADTKKDVPPPGQITFVGKNAVATANGIFKKWSFGKVTFDPDVPENIAVEVSVDVASIDTNSKRRDKHLRTADFFDVENYPFATLKIHTVKPGDKPDTFIGKLDFKMHGIEKTYSDFVFTVVQRDPVKVRGAFTFNRMDFNIGSPKTRNPMSVKEEIPITFSASLPK